MIEGDWYNELGSRMQIGIDPDGLGAHGALIRTTTSPTVTCYEGEQLWTPSITNYNTTTADSGWSGSQTGKSQCFLMATGHSYVVFGSRTTINLDVLHQF